VQVRSARLLLQEDAQCGTDNRPAGDRGVFCVAGHL
jgi:hypothetical protein